MDVTGKHWDVFFERVFIKDEYPIDMKKVECIVDSGTSLFYLPPEKFEALGNFIIKDRKECKHYVKEDLFACETTDLSSFPSIYF